MHLVDYEHCTVLSSSIVGGGSIALSVFLEMWRGAGYTERGTPEYSAKKHIRITYRMAMAPIFTIRSSILNRHKGVGVADEMHV